MISYNNKLIIPQMNFQPKEIYMQMNHQAIKKIDKAVRLLKEASYDEADDVKNSFHDRYEEVKESFFTKASGIGEKVKKNALSVDREVKKKPWRYIGAAALAGSFLGFLCSKKR